MVGDLAGGQSVDLHLDRDRHVTLREHVHGRGIVTGRDAVLGRLCTRDGQVDVVAGHLVAGCAREGHDRVHDEADARGRVLLRHVRGCCGGVVPAGVLPGRHIERADRPIPQRHVQGVGARVALRVAADGGVGLRGLCEVGAQILRVPRRDRVPVGDRLVQTDHGGQRGVRGRRRRLAMGVQRPGRPRGCDALPRPGVAEEPRVRRLETRIGAVGVPVGERAIRAVPGPALPRRVPLARAQDAVDGLPQEPRPLLRSPQLRRRGRGASQLCVAVDRGRVGGTAVAAGCFDAHGVGVGGPGVGVGGAGRGRAGQDRRADEGGGQDRGAGCAGGGAPGRASCWGSARGDSPGRDRPRRGGVGWSGAGISGWCHAAI